MDQINQRLPSRYLLVIILFLLVELYLYSQKIIGSEPQIPCGIRDNLEILTSGINAYLRTHPVTADWVMILYSGFGDLAVLFLLAFAWINRSVESILPLFVFVFFRQILECLVSLPLPEGLIWHYPGFPSLFSNYSIYNDFYYSAYVGINILKTMYLWKFKIKWVNVAGILIIIYEAFADLILRSHYTADIFTSTVTAIAVFLYTRKLSLAIDRKISFSRFNLVLFSIICFFLYYFLQTFIIYYRTIPLCNIKDLVHQFVLPINDFLFYHVRAGDVVLIIMNAILDLLSLFILILIVWKRNARPMLITTFFIIIRQVMQLLVKLPTPIQSIWHYPGFISLFQSYKVTSDFYFSGHTGISLIAALEMSYFHKRWLTILGFSLFGFELVAVLVMHVHYTMDVFTAIMTVGCLKDLAFKIAPPINQFLGKR